MPDKSNSASTGTRNVHQDGRNYSNHVNGSRSLPNSAVHKSRFQVKGEEVVSLNNE